MTDQQTAAAIVADSRNACDETAMESVIVRALQAARSENMDANDVDLVAPTPRVVATLRAKAPPGHIIDDAGEVRRVDGRLPILADGVVAEYGNSYWYWDTINTIHQPTKYGWTERVLVSCDPHDAEYSWTTDPGLCYSTREAAEAAKEASK